MPDKNTLGRQRLPPEKQLLCDWYTNTVHSYHSEERREGGAGWAKGLKEKDGEREGEEGNETGGDKPVPLYEKKSQSMTRNLPSGTQTFWFALRAFAGWTRQYVNAVFNCTHRKKGVWYIAWKHLLCMLCKIYYFAHIGGSCVKEISFRQ